MSGNRTDRRGQKDPEEYIITLTDRRRSAKALWDENDRETREGRDIALALERFGYGVEIERN